MNVRLPPNEGGKSPLFYKKNPPSFGGSYATDNDTIRKIISVFISVMVSLYHCTTIYGFNHEFWYPILFRWYTRVLDIRPHEVSKCIIYVPILSPLPFYTIPIFIFECNEIFYLLLIIIMKSTKVQTLGGIWWKYWNIWIENTFACIRIIVLGIYRTSFQHNLHCFINACVHVVND